MRAKHISFTNGTHLFYRRKPPPPPPPFHHELSPRTPVAQKSHPSSRPRAHLLLGETGDHPVYLLGAPGTVRSHGPPVPASQGRRMTGRTGRDGTGRDGVRGALVGCLPVCLISSIDIVHHESQYHTPAKTGDGSVCTHRFCINQVKKKSTKSLNFTWSHGEV